MKTALFSNAVLTEPPVTLSVIMAVRRRVAMTARPVLMKRGRLFSSLIFMEVPCRTDWYNILSEEEYYDFNYYKRMILEIHRAINKYI